jgi:nucleotide-binding universal stress UspA family protein
MNRGLLVPLDGTEHSEQALLYAQMLSQNLQIPVGLMLAFIAASAVWARGLLGGRSTPVAEILEDLEGGSTEREAEEYLEGLAEPLRRQGFDVSAKAVPGDPPALVAHEAAADPLSYSHEHPRALRPGPLAIGQHHRPCDPSHSAASVAAPFG